MIDPRSHILPQLSSGATAGSRRVMPNLSAGAGVLFRAAAAHLVIKRIIVTWSVDGESKEGDAPSAREKG